jgi:hypothetical protein
MVLEGQNHRVVCESELSELSGLSELSELSELFKTFRTFRTFGFLFHVYVEGNTINIDIQIVTND